LQMGFLKWLVKCVRKNITNKNLYVYLSSAIPMWIVAWLSPFLVGLAAFLLWTAFWILHKEHGRCWDKDSICEHLYVDLSRSIFGPIIS